MFPFAHKERTRGSISPVVVTTDYMITTGGGEDDTDDDIFLTPTDLACIEKIESPVLRRVAKRHLVEYNIEVTNRLELLRSQQSTHAPKYTNILCSTYTHIKSHIKEDTTIPFIVTVKGSQSTTSRPTIESWCRINRAKGDAIKLIAEEMRATGYTTSLFLDDAFYITKDRYYSGGERLTLQCIPNTTNNVSDTK